MKKIETDILIVGGGIAGATLAAALRLSGYRIVLLEQRKAPLDTARGDHLQPCNVEAFARWGLLDEFLKRGATKRVGHEFRTPAGTALLALRYDELAIPYPYFLVVNHERIAETCLELAAQNPQFTRLQPVAARHFEIDDDDDITSAVVEVDGELTTILPQLVIGADGQNSRVREALGLTADEHVYRHPMVAMFAARPADLRPRDYFFRYGGAHGMLVIQQRMDGTIKITTPVGNEGTAFWKQSTSSERAALLGRRAQILRDGTTELAGFYPVKMVHCHEYVRGNTVLIGDAAHAIHPARGQGLNMGIASLTRLLQALPTPDRIHHRPALRWELQRYQAEIKPLYDQVVARNHEAALQMEVMADGENAEFARQEDAMIRQLHQRPEMRHMHLLDVTGYPQGALCVAEREMRAAD